MADDRLIVGLSADIKDLQNKLGEAQNLLKSYSREAENVGNKGSNGFNKLTSSIKGLVGAYIGLQAAQMAVSKAFNTALQLDSIEAAYTQIFKSSEIATLQLERLKDKADELGLSFIDLAASYKTFAGSAYTTGLSLKQTNEIFDAVSNAAAQMKLNSEQTQGTLLALAQMISKGTVSMEELRQQLGERLPGAMKIFADGLGVSTEELNKMIASGKVMATDALPKFAARLNDVYKTTEPMKGLQAAVNRLSNTFTEAVQGGAVGKFFEAIVNGATAAIGVVENAYKGFQILINNSKFQGNQIFDSGTGEINKLFETGGDKAVTQLAELIAEYNKLGKAFGFATEEGKAYLGLIKIAYAAQQELLKKPVATKSGGTSRVVGGENMEMMGGSPEQIKTANELFDLYKKSPQILSILGQEYASNPFFRDLVNGDIAEKTKEYNEQLKELSENYNNIKTPESLQMILDKFLLTQESINNIITLLGQGLTTAFESALSGTESFGTAFIKVLEGIIIKLVAALAAALALTAVISILSGGTGVIAGMAMPGFKNIIKALSGGVLDFGKGTTNRVASTVGAGVGAGNVSFEIRGDKLYGVLQNYQSRLDRLQ
jgi:tape measure domain-containing protein